eukprot:TRINITY_DN2008_c0_g3_i1.p1 TRINITY_DN2008_c0_g3~~TRINITY_DN2008_c0_g3_i1.p1  ORF type:complete len:931 (+),score=212.22 TRINITY_DN2008_c0_g3_i1:78-2870(+)
MFSSFFGSTQCRPQKCAAEVSEAATTKGSEDAATLIGDEPAFDPPPRRQRSSELCGTGSQKAHSRLRRLQELDAETIIPFIIVELRGLSDGDGYVEICGKDEYGVYGYLDEWLSGTWRCRKLNAGDLTDDTPIPFCDAMYSWDGYKAASDGTTNMGLATMQLVDFMCCHLTWTLGVVNGGSVGKKGEIREQQIIFKAPHPMNMVAAHLMVELRSAGFVEVCGNDRAAMDTLHHCLVGEYGAQPTLGHSDFSDRYYKCKAGVFKERGDCGENNVGMLTARFCDRVVQILPGWSLVTMNGGNYGEKGDHREQQLVFRKDHHPLGAAPHVIVELRDAGYVEVCGQDTDDIHKRLQQWLEEKWGCVQIIKDEEKFCDMKFTWKTKDMLVASAEVTEFFHEFGWQMQVCSQGAVVALAPAQSNGTGSMTMGKTQSMVRSDVREQQILFRPGASGLGIVEPHLFVEVYMGEGSKELYGQKDKTQLLGNQHIRIREVGNCREHAMELKKFIEDYLGGELLESGEVTTYSCDIFLSRGTTDNNLGMWTMRFCDFMVDRLGWSFVVCNVCNLGDFGLFREQQLVFRWDGERRVIPLVKQDNASIEQVQFVGIELPRHWSTPKVLQLRQLYNTVRCNHQELKSLQEIFDVTFKRVLTRDRIYEYQVGVSEEMPFRLEVVHAFRCEHLELFRRFAERRKKYPGGLHDRPKTLDAGAQINNRLAEGEAYLAHGTNPSSAMGILKTGFKLNHAGKGTGTMFGYGIYLAECVSKSDEYSREDNGGTYPGLRAILLCRCLVGKPHLVYDPGDHVQTARSTGCDCVVGDREKKVGTYREFVFPDEAQVLPEYAVIYRRIWDSDAVPPAMRQSVRGTTGRQWQMQMSAGWGNLPADLGAELTREMDAGKETYARAFAGATWTFNLKTMNATNPKTQKVQKIRPPMRK